MAKKIQKILLVALGLGASILLGNAIAATTNGGPVLTPEPISTSLFLLGGAAIGVKSYINKKKNSGRSK